VNEQGAEVAVSPFWGSGSIRAKNYSSVLYAILTPRLGPANNTPSHLFKPTFLSNSMKRGSERSGS
jgi:hypothetical protein